MNCLLNQGSWKTNNAYYDDTGRDTYKDVPVYKIKKNLHTYLPLNNPVFNSDTKLNKVLNGLYDGFVDVIKCRGGIHIPPGLP